MGETGGAFVKKAPAFQFYPADWLSSQRVSLMTLEEEGAYIRLLCYCWKNGELPNDPEQLARLIGKGASTTLASNVATMFQADGCRLLHDKLNALRTEREQWLEKSRKGGLASAAKRAKQREIEENESKGGCNLVDDCLQPKANTSSSSSSINSPPPSNDIPSLETVLEYATMIGMAAWKAEDWWLDMQSKGWRINNTEITNWQAGLSRIKQFWEADGRPMERPGRGSPANSSSAKQMPIWKQKQVLQETLEKHKGNPDSTYYVQGDKAAREEYKQTKQKLRDIEAREREEAMA